MNTPGPGWSHCRFATIVPAAFALCTVMALPCRAPAQTNDFVARIKGYPVVRGTIADVSRNLTNQVRIQVTGTAMLDFAPGYFFLHDDTGDIRVQCIGTNLPQRGDLVEVIGLPRPIETLPWLQVAEFRRVGEGVIPPPIPITAAEALTEKYDAQYVRMRGRVIGVTTYSLRGRTNEGLLLDADGVLSKALFPQGSKAERRFPVNTVAEFTGICRLGARIDESRQHYIHILLNGIEAVNVVQAAPAWSARSLLRVVMFMVVLGVISLAWIAWERRKIRFLEASEERFRAMIENSYDVTVVLNADGTSKYMSPSGLKLFGFDKTEGPFMKNGFADVIHPDDLPRIAEAHAAVLDKPGSSRTVSGYRIITAQGKLRYAEATGTNCLQVPGIEGVVVNLRDITERVQADEAAHRSRAVTETINYFATSLLERDSEEDVLWDLAQNCISKLGFVDCVIYLLDRERAVLVQKAALGPKNPEGRVIVNPINIPVGQGIVGSVAATREPELIADTSLDPRYIVDDERRFSEITVPIVANNEVIGVIDSEHPSRNFFTAEHLKMLTSIASLCANKLVRIRAEEKLLALNTDLEQRVASRTAELRGEVVAREQAEAELRVALAAEKELNQLKSSFVSMVSHEFRTPLEVILSSSNILDRYLDRLAPEKRAAQLRAIRKSVRRMNDLIDDVLMLGKLDAGVLCCQPVPLDLAMFCRRAAREIESAVARDGAIQFTVDGINGEALADEGLLQHILTNILGNAVKYSPPDKAVEFTLRRCGPDAQFIIRDHGCGIPAADQARLFTAFYRGSNVAQTSGSGLGLVIVKRCVDLHGGAIQCQSEQGAGTTFTVTLPLFDGTRIFRRRQNPGAEMRQSDTSATI
ncbi:MAG TPA: ATP-binding protein [Methylomirabilota bacterium]|nr:ATP-binding protein [Methylomirabilota bacterium]